MSAIFDPAFRQGASATCNWARVAATATVD